MSNAEPKPQPDASEKNDQIVFWGCFLALITTAFGFITRVFLVNTWASEEWFNLDAAQAGKLTGIGIWPFAVSIIGVSLLIDKIGYKTAMIMAFVGHIAWAIMGVSAFFIQDRDVGYQLLFWGSLVLALGNGAVEAFINPVVATMFSKEKTKWLNILHAGWPGGLVIAGMITIFIAGVPWWIKVGMIAVPAVIYLLMLIPCKFPVSERVSSGVSYKEMLQEFGILGAALVAVLVMLTLMDFFPTGPKPLFVGIAAAIAISFGAFTQSIGRPLMLVLVVIMMPLATTEIGTDGWITAIMEDIAKANNFHPGWVLVYTSAIMMVLRFFAGPIVHKFSPLGLLAVSAVLAIAGLYTLSISTGLIIFGAATLYGVGKTFFWPTMLGVVAEQCPKGGAFTLNAISGIGMLAVGTLGFPYIGKLQIDKEIEAVSASAEIKQMLPGAFDGDKLTITEPNPKPIYEVIKYDQISVKKRDALIDQLPKDQQQPAKDEFKKVKAESTQGALKNMTIFPLVMLIAYILLILYFKSQGGYKPIELGGKDH